MVNPKAIFTIVLVLSMASDSHQFREEIKTNNIFGKEINKALRCVLDVGQVLYDRIKKGTNQKNKFIDKEASKKFLQNLSEEKLIEIVEEIEKTKPLLEICQSMKLIKEWDSKNSPHIANCSYSTDFLVQQVRALVDDKADFTSKTLDKLRNHIVLHFENCFEKVEMLFPSPRKNLDKNHWEKKLFHK